MILLMVADGSPLWPSTNLVSSSATTPLIANKSCVPLNGSGGPESCDVEHWPMIWRNSSKSTKFEISQTKSRDYENNLKYHFFCWSCSKAGKLAVQQGSRSMTYNKRFKLKPMANKKQTISRPAQVRNERWSNIRYIQAKCFHCPFRFFDVLRDTHSSRIC